MYYQNVELKTKARLGAHVSGRQNFCWARKTGKSYWIRFNKHMASQKRLNTNHNSCNPKVKFKVKTLHEISAKWSHLWKCQLWCPAALLDFISRIFNECLSFSRYIYTDVSWKVYNSDRVIVHLGSYNCAICPMQLIVWGVCASRLWTIVTSQINHHMIWTG